LDGEDLVNGELLVPLSADLERVPWISFVGIDCFDGNGDTDHFDVDCDVNGKTSSSNDSCLDVDVDANNEKFDLDGDSDGFDLNDADGDDDKFDGDDVNFVIEPLDVTF
jgi:hypothetical protein